MSDWKAKRFWKAASIAPVDGGYTVLLDARPVRTPIKAELTLPSERLAQAIAAEWDAQDGEIDPLTMPYTRAANAALDKVTPQHAEVADMLAAYGDADLLCYRADTPAELVARQNAIWNPLLDWAERDLGARLAPRTGVIHAPQDPAQLAALRAQVHALDPFSMAAFHDLVTLSGSLVIGFAALRNHLPLPDLWAASRLDETWQEEQWGADDEATAHAQIKRRAFEDAHSFYQLVHAKH